MTHPSPVVPGRPIGLPIEGPSAWHRRDLRTEDYTILLGPECRDEILRAAAELRERPLPTIVLDPGAFDMPRCREAMARARRALDAGRRFAVIERLPLEELTPGEAVAIYWLLASMVSRPVAQSLDGTLIYDVRDTGRQALPGSGVRPDKTNAEIRFHNDNSYNRTPPDYVGLLCLRPAKSGGRSRVLSFHTMYNELLARRPEVVPRLYEDFWFDRQREYRPGESPIFAAPILDQAGELRTRFSAHQIRGGYALKGEPLDRAGADAIAAMLDTFEDEALSLDFDFAPGQIQFVHNRALGHSRTAFEDFAEPERRRHLVRLWMRDYGHRAYPG